MPEDRRFLIPNKSLPFSAALIGISFCSGRYHIRRKLSPFTVLEYVTDGEGYVMQDGEFKLVGKDKIYICPANMPHDYYSSADKPWTKIACPRDNSYYIRLSSFFKCFFGVLFPGTSLLWILFIGNDYTDAQVCFI